MKKQILGLELLRGLCALAVAVYHGLYWSDTARLYSWGLYGVYIFFVISGAVLYVNYHDGRVPIGSFLLRRFARLWPLYALAVAATAITSQQVPSLKHLLNLSMLFGFTNPGATSTVVGGWSLGIEMVMYVLFPLLVVFTKRTSVMICTLVVLLLLRVAMSELFVRDGLNWVAYTQVSSFLFFFFAGMGLAKLPRLSASLAVPIGVTAAALFLFVGESAEAALTGPIGILYSLAAVALVACFLWSAFAPVSKFMGEISYGLYLFHPIAWAVATWAFPSMPVIVRIVLMVVASSVGAWTALRLYERPVKAMIFRLAERHVVKRTATES